MGQVVMKTDLKGERFRVWEAWNKDPGVKKRNEKKGSVWLIFFFLQVKSKATVGI